MARIRGAKELRADLKRLPEALREEAMKPVKASTVRMHRRVMELLNSASSLAPFYHGLPGMQDVDTPLHPAGSARKSYRYSIVNKGLTGRVGQLSPGAERAGFHLYFFLNGTSHQPARPVHDIAFEEERNLFASAQQKALLNVLSRLP